MLEVVVNWIYGSDEPDSFDEVPDNLENAEIKEEQHLGRVVKVLFLCWFEGEIWKTCATFFKIKAEYLLCGSCIQPKKNSLKFKLLAFWRKTQFSDQKCTYENVTKNLGRALPHPPHLDKIKRRATFFVKPSLMAPYLAGEGEGVRQWNTRTGAYRARILLLAVEELPRWPLVGEIPPVRVQGGEVGHLLLGNPPGV